MGRPRQPLRAGFATAARLRTQGSKRVSGMSGSALLIIFSCRQCKGWWARCWVGVGSSFSALAKRASGCHASEIATEVLQRARANVSGITAPADRGLEHADRSWRPQGGAAGLFTDPADWVVMQNWVPTVTQAWAAAVRPGRSCLPPARFAHPFLAHAPGSSAPCTDHRGLPAVNMH